jgi:eukaryotic-like serine/threonine-protein kinase
VVGEPRGPGRFATDVDPGDEQVAGAGDSGKKGVGERVAGKYELKRVIGAGSMGAVYEGEHIDLGKRVAIKLVRPDFCESAEIVARFRREARAASAALSEHIVQIFDFGRDEALGFYMICEFLNGEDLDARLAREHRIDLREATVIGWQVARGLARAHAVGVIHRDLKPANIFLTRRDDGSLLAKILDFGVSKFDATASGSIPGADRTAEPTLTAHGTTLGTPQYMSPEQCEGKAALDGRTDVWSLAAVLYEMLAGEPAISGAGGFVAAMQQIVSTDVVPLATRAPWVPEELARVVDAGLARRREARIADATRFADRLLEAYPLAGVRNAMDETGPSTLKWPDPERVQPTPAGTVGPASHDSSPPSSAEEGIEIFVRTGEVPVPVGKGR